MDQSFKTLFFNAADSLFLIRPSGEITRNKAAEALQRRLDVPLERIIDIATGNGCMLHTTTDKCLNCEVKVTWTPHSFPLFLQNKQGLQERFSGSLSQISADGAALGQLLSLRSSDGQERLQQVIENKRLIEYVNQAHEAERKAISQELHDGLAQSIYSLMLEVRQLKRMHDRAQLVDRIGDIDEDFVALLREVKQLAVDLRPTALDDLGLIPAIEALLQRMIETTGVLIHFIPILSRQRFSDRLETVTYRVLQESLMNSVKYAGVDEIWATLHDRDGYLRLEVRDHGQGFLLDSAAATGNGGLGLLHMKERAEAVGGRLDIQSEVGKGTTVFLILPID